MLTLAARATTSFKLPWSIVATDDGNEECIQVVSATDLKFRQVLLQCGHAIVRYLLAPLEIERFQRDEALQVN